MGKKKLLFDAKWLFDGHVSGKEVVTNQLKYLVRSQKFELYVLLKKSDRNKKLNYSSKQFTPVYVNSFNNGITNSFLVGHIVKRFKIDIILFHNHIPYFNLKCMKVCFIHDILYLDYPEYFSLSERLYFRMITKSIRKSDHVITISNSERQRIQKWGLKKESNISFVYNGINDSFLKFKLNDELKSKIKEKYQLPERFILYLGRINTRKNIGNLIRAMGNIDAPLYIGGEPNHKVEKLNLDNSKAKVKFLGYIPEKELPYIYNLATVFCFPSYAEGFGLPPIESMACSTPVAVSNSTCFPEVCGEAASYFTPNNPDQISEAINNILSNDQYKTELTQKGYEQSQKYSWSNSINQLINILENKFEKFENSNNRI